MPQYIVLRKELWSQFVTVEATSKEEAIEKAFQGEGEIRDDPRFQDFLPASLWTAEEAD